MSCSEKDLWIRAGTIQQIRHFFIDQDYLEIETPLLIQAPAPEAHIDAISIDGFFLHTSPELCMKRMLSKGHEKIFQICKCFREYERGDLHLPEFTILEWYRVGSEYVTMMGECESMLAFIFEQAGFDRIIEYQGRVINLKRPWQRISVKDAFFQYSPISMDAAIQDNKFDEIMVEYIEPNLSNRQPVFLYDYPSSLAALSQLKQSDKMLAERFELYIGGVELANGFTELTDAGEQRNRFERENANRQKLGKEAYPLPEKFLHDLKRMPPSAGIALGVDRLIMILCNRSSIEDVVSFTPEEV